MAFDKTMLASVFLVSIVCMTLMGTDKELPVKVKSIISLSIETKKNESPLNAKFATLRIKNSSAEAVDILTQLTNGASSYVDIRTSTDKGIRLTREFYTRSISSPYYTELTKVATVPSGGLLDLPIDIFDGVEAAAIKPGKYKCRVRFKYDDLKLDATSEEIEIEVTKDHIDKMKK